MGSTRRSTREVRFLKYRIYNTNENCSRKSRRRGGTGIGSLMCGVEDALEIAEEELAMVEEVSELCVCESNSASKIGFLESKSTNGVRG